MDVTYWIAIAEQSTSNPSSQPHVYCERSAHKVSGNTYVYAIDRPISAGCNVRFVDLAAAQAFSAIFPKWLRVKTTGLGGSPEYKAIVQFHVSLSPDGNNAGVNETGIKRLAAFITKARAAGHTVTYKPDQWGNSSPRDAEGYGWIKTEEGTK